ncbi:17719_t:CDS:2 [Funneliformis caledonium]|uniref:Small ribosomal subunit protein uS9m n=1 Tax=Funneliformis caledonium TaxID=1117310 RepID=A0A9N9H6D6_9GLOM|nr:17719_t:CDS:2 [Funneliformis caledonium]
MSKLRFAYNIGRVLGNNLKSQCSRTTTFKSYSSNPNLIFSFVILRSFSTGKTQQNIRLSKHESIDNFSKVERPASISYFTAKPTYNDFIIQLDDLLHKHRTTPTKLIDKNAPPTLWILKQHLDEKLGLRLKTNQYRLITRKLHRLDKIMFEFAPELHNFLDLFRRYDPEKEKKDIEAMKTVDPYGRALAIGRRKEATAQVWVVEGDGHVLVNGIPVADYFPLLKDRESILYPFQVTGLLGKYNVWTKVKGGGPTGQAGAIAHGITKALIIHNSDLKPILREAKLVTRDTRVVERKKPGLAKARKRYTWVKR